MFDLQHVDHAVAEFRDVGEQFKDLLLQLEVRRACFWSRTIVTAELDFANNPGRRIPYGLPMPHMEAFEPAEVQAAHYLEKLLSLRGQCTQLGSNHFGNLVNLYCSSGRGRLNGFASRTGTASATSTVIIRAKFKWA